MATEALGQGTAMNAFKNLTWRIFNMAEAHISIIEKKLKVLIKSIFLEEIQKQEKNIINIISGNF